MKRMTKRDPGRVDCITKLGCLKSLMINFACFLTKRIHVINLTRWFRYLNHLLKPLWGSLTCAFLSLSPSFRMSLKIYEMAHSPYCIPITQALTAVGVAFDRVAVPNWDRAEIIRLTKGAYYQVPVLVHDGTVVYESSEQSLDVSRYVDQVFAAGKLFPADQAGIQEIMVEHIENELEGLTFKLCDIHYIPSITDLIGRTMVIRHKERRFGRGCVDAWRREEAVLHRAADRLLGRFDSKLQQSQFLLGDDAPTYVDFALLGVVGNYSYGGHHNLSEKPRASKLTQPSSAWASPRARRSMWSTILCAGGSFVT